MVDVGRDDRPPAPDLVPDELRIEPLANGDELHLLGDLATARVVHLGDPVAGLGPQRLADRAPELFARRASSLGGTAVVARVDGPAVVRLHVLSVEDPRPPERR